MKCPPAGIFVVLVSPLLLAPGCSRGDAVSSREEKRTISWGEGEWFLLGANYPWHYYGHDFGQCAWGHDGVSTNESRERVDTDFADMSRHGVHVARWFLFCDGRASPEFDSDGLTTGMDEEFYEDVDTALEIAEKHNVFLIFVLLDFHLADKGEEVNGVQTGGRSSLIVDGHQRRAFLEKALTPLLKRYGNHKHILAWDIINEPEGAMDFDGGRWVKEPVSVEAMQSFVKEVVGCIHKHTSQHATVGSASRSYLDYWRDCGLDFYQYHYYDKMEQECPLEYPCTKIGLDKPCIVGEFPTKGTQLGLRDYLDVIHGNGYAGALAWSYRAKDDASDFGSSAQGLREWSHSHRPLVDIDAR